MRFRLIDVAKKEFPVQRLLQGSWRQPDGYFASGDRLVFRRRQHEDMALRSVIRSAFALSERILWQPAHDARADG